MPLIKVQTSIENLDRKDVKILLTNLSSKLAKHLGKPESYVMTSFEADVSMTFGGTFEPTCYLEVKSVGYMGSSKTHK